VEWKLKTETDPTGVVTTYTYQEGDDKSFLEKVESKNGANTLMKFEYAPYDDASVASATENLGGTSSTVGYDYDTRAQLKEEDRQGAGASYRGYHYDQAGNLSQLDFAPQGQQQSFWSTSFNQLQSVTGALSYGLTYGTDGAVAGFDDGTNEWTYAYDDENRLKEVRLGQNVVSSCVYDAFGRPAVESFSPPGQQPVTRYLVWEGDELLMEVGTNGAVAARQSGGVGSRGGCHSREVGNPDFSVFSAGPRLARLGADHLGAGHGCGVLLDSRLRGNDKTCDG
jgi:YD repeat-containing protein